MTYKVLSAFLLLGLAAGCGQKPAAGSNSSSSTSPTSPPAVVQATTSAPLALNLFTKYDNTQGIWNATFDESGTTTCSATAANPHAICTVHIPEGRLYFSGLTFQFSWLNQNAYCKLLTFQPYYYIVSTTAIITPPWATASIDCTARPLAAGCIGGAAGYMNPAVPNFPQSLGVIYVPDESQASGSTNQSVNFPSADSSIYGSNRKMANDLPVAKRGNTYAAGAIQPTANSAPTSEAYVANSMVDYYFSCRDDWYDPTNYTLQLFINEQDSATGAIDNIASWKEAP